MIIGSPTVELPNSFSPYSGWLVKVPFSLCFFTIKIQSDFNCAIHYIGAYAKFCGNLNYWEFPKVYDVGVNLRTPYEKLVIRHVK